MLKGAPIYAVCKRCCHEKLNTTQIYTHVTITELKKVHEKTHPGYEDRKPDENQSSAACVPRHYNGGMLCKSSSRRFFIKPARVRSAAKAKTGPAVSKSNRSCRSALAASLRPAKHGLPTRVRLQSVNRI